MKKPCSKATNTNKAHVFGNSSGAIIAMELAARYPEMMKKVVVHEPPVVKVLPDKNKWLAFFTNAEAGNTKFTFSVGIPFRAFAYIPEDFQARNAQNTEILIKDEMPAFINYQPDIQQLKDNKVDIIFAAGDLSLYKEKYFARCSTRKQAAESSRQLCVITIKNF